MNTTIEKRLHLDTQRAQRLEHLTSTQGMSEDALMSKALDLLFGEQEQEVTRQEDLEALRQMDAEAEGTHVLRLPFSINVDEIVSVVETPIYPQCLRRAGDLR